MVKLRDIIVVLALLAVTGTASASVTIHNFIATSIGSLQGVARFDTSGNLIDLHDGEIMEMIDPADGVLKFFWYGTMYGCGFTWLPGTGHTFCGFGVSKSTDLVRWTPPHTIFDVTPTVVADHCGIEGCFSIHVKYVPSRGTRPYVAWLNTPDIHAGNIEVWTASTPDASNFQMDATPTPAVISVLDGEGTIGQPAVYEDGALWQDPDDLSLWLIYHAGLCDRNGSCGNSIRVEQVGSNGISLTGSYSVITHGTPAAWEAPAMLKRSGVYYSLLSGVCGYCVGGGSLVYATSSAPTGPWSGLTTISSDSCHGQERSVSKLTKSGSDVYLIQIDHWQPYGTTPGYSGWANQAMATQGWWPLSFTGSAIDALTCDDSFTYSVASSGPEIDIPGVDQSPAGPFALFISEGFPSNSVRFLQTFTPSRTANHTIHVSTFKGPGSAAISNCQASFGGGAASCATPDSDLFIDIVSVNQSTHKPTGVLLTCQIDVAAMSYSAMVTNDCGPIAMTAGTRYGYVLRSNNTVSNAGYGQTYNDAGLTTGTDFFVSTDGGSTWDNSSWPNRNNLFFDTCDICVPPVPVSTKGPIGPRHHHNAP